MSKELLLQKAFPVIEGIPEQLYLETVARGFEDFLPQEKNLSYITTCEKVKRDSLKIFQKELYKELYQFGYPNKQLKTNDQNNAKIDRWLGKFLYEKMEISPSVAATLGMWQFINLFLCPSVVYWRWGDVKDRFIGIRRNYFGTQWWRHYFFTKKTETSREYMFMSEDEIVALYERTGTRGLPNQIDNNILWYRKLCSKYNLEHRLTSRLYREVIKKYNAELGYRNYFSLEQEDLFEIYENVFKSCLNMKIEDLEDKVVENVSEKDSLENQEVLSNVLLKENNISDLKKTTIDCIKDTNSESKTNILFSNDTINISENILKSTIEISFIEEAREITKFKIKQLGFKYLSSQKKWCAINSEKTIESLKQIFNF